jgi:hypothetical protein
VSQRERRVELRKRFASGARLDQTDLAHPLRKITTRKLTIPGRLCVSGERTHERAPRISPVVGTPRIRSGGGSQRLDRAQMRRQLFAEKRVYFVTQSRCRHRISLSGDKNK